MMQDNLFASIMENDKLVTKYRAAPPTIAETTGAKYEPSGNVGGESSSASEAENANTENTKPILQSSAVNLPKYRICIDSVDKVAEASMLKSSYIAYRIRFTRMSDLQSHACWKRFKELSSWFAEMQQKHPELTSDHAPKFPNSSDTWMGGSQNDPLSEFVLKRKLDLETFFKALFGEFPTLVRHPKVREFFELNQMPEEKISVAATRMAAQSLSSSSRSTGSAGANSAATLGKSGSTATGDGRPRQDISWYHYDKSVMQDILRRDSVFDVNAARMVKKDTMEYKGDITVAEIMNFDDHHSKMQSAHQTVRQ